MWKVKNEHKHELLCVPVCLSDICVADCCDIPSVRSPCWYVYLSVCLPSGSYSGVIATEVAKFDGCNLHDNMIAYIKIPLDLEESYRHSNMAKNLYAFPQPVGYSFQTCQRTNRRRNVLEERSWYVRLLCFAHWSTSFKEESNYIVIMHSRFTDLTLLLNLV